MGAVTTLPACLDAMRAGLILRVGLADVNVYSGPIVDDTELGREYILLGVEEMDDQYRYLTLARKECFESMDVPCELLGIATGTGEAGIKAARDRAFTILSEVHQYLKANDTVAGTVRDAAIVRYKAKQYIYSEAERCCEIKFGIEVKSEFTPA